MPQALAVLALVIGPTAASSAAEVSVPVTVAEPAGLARTGEPASGGVPFKKGQVQSVDSLALFDNTGKPVPAQFSRLAPYEDGSVQWALVDVLVDLPAKGTAEFTVGRGPSAAPPRPLTVVEVGGLITVDTGAAVFKVNQAAFTLLESVTVAGRQVAGPGAVAIADADGRPFTAGKPARVSWEYQGPLRATLRVDGPYLNAAGEPFIFYTTRLTFWAGSSAVRVDHSIRNSNPKEGDDAKMKWATVGLELGFQGAGAGQGPNWAAAGDGAVGLLVTERHTGGCFPGGGAKARYQVKVDGGNATVWAVPEGRGGKGVYGYGDGFFALADCTHKDTEVWLDFYTGARDAAANQARVKALLSKLHLLADGAWISETAALSGGRFGTLQDEIAAYQKWGWKGWDDPRKQAPARRPHDPEAYVGGVLIHNDSESDSAELALLMYVRTGERGWFDLGEAWARYYKSHAITRTDGFVYDGFGHVRSAVSGLSKRPTKGLKFGWYGPKQYNWNDTRLCMCHTWGTGVFDYYCLTGDVDALEGGLDVAEVAAITFPDKKNAVGTPLVLGRGWGRQFNVVTRAYQCTREAKWKQAMDYFAQRHLKAPNRQPSGLYADYGGAGLVASMSPTLKAYCEANGITWEVKGGVLNVSKGGETWQVWTTCQSFEFAACAEAVARCAEVTGDPEMKKLVVDLARGARDVYWSKHCNHHGLKGGAFGFPHKDQAYDPGAWDPAHANCPGDDGGSHSGYHARFYADICARAYSQTGDPAWLDFARNVWNRGSKRRNWTTSQYVPDDEVAAFASHKPPNGDGIDIRNCARLFYEAARAK